MSLKLDDYLLTKLNKRTKFSNTNDFLTLFKINLLIFILQLYVNNKYIKFYKNEYYLYVKKY